MYTLFVQAENLLLDANANVKLAGRWNLGNYTC